MTSLLRIALASAVGALLFASPAMAQDEEERKIQYKQKTEIDFEGVEVAGELVKPQGALLLDRKRANFNPLIQLREDFNEEMDQSVNQIK
jgi:hypothetical protein